MLCKYGNVQVDEIPMMKLIIKPKNYGDIDDVKELHDSFKQVLKNLPNADKFEVSAPLLWGTNYTSLDKIVTLIFRVVIPLIMFLCFF
jgi:hypothetical protein